MDSSAFKPDLSRLKSKVKSWGQRAFISVPVISSLAVSTFASGTSGTTSSAITDVGTALTGIMGYISGVTSEMLSNDAWILGMGFFVLLFIAGFVSYWFRIGRR